MSHGPLFDEFHAQSGSPHNGAQADSFNAERADATPHGELMDDGYRAADPVTPGGHGEKWDSFPWTDMPLIHGAHWDSDFAAPAMLNDVEHGTWMDVFRGGNQQVRAIVDGKDVEAQVIECHPDHVKIKTRDGSIAEAALSQLRAFRGPAPSRTSIKSASVGHTDAPITASSADAPSAHSAKASGGHLPQTHKTIDEALAGLDVLKSVDATETAVQGDTSGSVGHRTNCPRGGSSPCGSAVKGRCSACNAGVSDHAALGKTEGPLVDVLKTIGELA